MVAARSARFTAVDLQQHGPATAGPVDGDEASVSGTPGGSPGGNPDGRASLVWAVTVQFARRPADEEWNGDRSIDGGAMRTGLPFDDVLGAAQAGAAWAFEVLYRDLAPVVTGYLRLHGAAEPDDLASETFIGVFTGLAGFSGDEDALRSWVFTIAHRRLVDDWRRRSRRPQVTDEAEDLGGLIGGDVEDDVMLRVGTEDVHRLCAGLPDDQRSVLLLRILADLTVEQVAEVMGRSMASVKALQRRGLRTLRDQLEPASEKSARVRAPLSVSPAMTGTR
jgi:RNA polymerase sigma-70 factor (ECF subfamily)